MKYLYIKVKNHEDFGKLKKNYKYLVDLMAPYIDDPDINKGINHNIGFAEASAE